MESANKKVLIIGAGPAGVTAAYELTSLGYNVTVLEETNEIGGIAKTVNYKGNRMDMGGHRFFSKSKEVNDFWEKFLPMQSSPSYDDIKLNKKIKLSNSDANPEEKDNVMLLRNRVSRILFDNKFYDYPIKLKFSTFKNLGIINTIIIGFSYIKSVIFKKKEDNLENFYINRFGKKLYSMFFEYYTENLWGRHPREIDASWGAQRVKGLSIVAIIKDIFNKIFKVKNAKVETSLIEEFKYPKLGPGQLWELIMNEAVKKGCTLITNAKVVKFNKSESKLTALTYETLDGENKTLEGDYFLSSMPIKDLVCGIEDTPADISNIAQGLPYRDYIALGVLVSKIKLKNETNIKTINNIIPDNWVYVQDRKVKMGRFQVYNNWSPYMVSDLDNTIWLALEYFVSENDNLWNRTEDEFASFAIDEMITLGLIDSKKDVLDYHEEKVKKAYPAYFDTYDRIDEVKNYLSNIENLYCIGRNGQHRYNNMDHSMLTAFEAASNIKNNIKDKSNIWNVNAEAEYHEENKNE